VTELSRLWRPATWPWSAIVVLGVGFLIAEQFPIRFPPVGAVSSDEVQESTIAETIQSGSLTRPLGFAIVGAFGVGALWLRRPLPGRALSWAAGGVFLLVLWCGASLLWSADPGLTARRLVAALLCFAGAWGFARRYDAEDLCLLALVTTTAYLLIGLAAEWAWGTLEITQEEYRLSGLLHPNILGAFCATGLLAALCLDDGRWSTRCVLGAVGGLHAVGLWLTKSRTAAMSLAVALAAMWLVTASARRRWQVAAVAWAVCTLALGAALLGVDVLETGQNLVFMGRREHVATLTGRTELWQQLLEYAAQRPLAGFGYGAFWTADRSELISWTQRWEIGEAHSAYLDLLLNVGAVGALTLTALALWALVRSGAAYRREKSAGHRFAFGMLAYGMILGVAQSQVTLPGLMAMIVGAVLLHAATHAGRRELTPDVAADTAGIAAGQGRALSVGPRIAGTGAPS